MITHYREYCLFCGKPREDIHHVICGRGYKRLADEDGLTAPVCRSCHEAIHRSEIAMKLSKMLGQMAWEKHLIATEGVSEDEAREQFRIRYSRSWL